MFTRSTVWTLNTQNDLWHPPKIIETIYKIQAIHILTVRSLTPTLLEISHLLGSDLLTSHEPIWPWTSTTNNRDHLLDMKYPNLKYEIRNAYLPCDTGVYLSSFSKFLLCNLFLIPHDLRPSPQIIRIMYSVWAIYMPSMRLLTVILLEIPCLQGFDLSWPQIIFGLHQKL